MTPLEIEKIREYTELSKLEVAGPLIPETCQPEETEDEEEVEAESENEEVAASETAVNEPKNFKPERTKTVSLPDEDDDGKYFSR